MPDDLNGNYDWRERMRRLEDSIERKRQERERLFEALRESNIRLHEDVVKVVKAIRDLIDRIPPENLR